MKLTLAIGFLLLLLTAKCDCHNEKVTGTGRAPCPTTCPERASVDCSAPAFGLAKQDASARAKTECDKAGGKLSGPDKWEEGTAHCVKVGNEWFVETTATGTFQCCPK